MTLLAANALTRYDHDGARLFDPIDLAVAAGDRLAVRGPSGIGKTLLLRTLTLLDSPDEGEVRYRGESLVAEKIPSFRRRVYLLAQSSPMVSGTVHENLALPFMIRSCGDKTLNQTRARELLELFSLENHYERAAAELSGGQRQAVALIRALLVDPEVLLADEPTSAMDPERVALAESLINEWQGTTKASIWVSHDADQLKRQTESSAELVRSA